MAEDSPRIAEATASDVDAVAKFVWDAWEEAGPDAPGWAGATEEVLEDLTQPENLLKRLGRPDRRIFAAWEGDRVVAFAANRRIDATEVELVGLIVLESKQGEGIGSRLLDAAMEAAREDAYTTMRVRTEAANEKALRFYEHRGFEAVETLVETIGDVTVEGVKLLRDL